MREVLSEDLVARIRLAVSDPGTFVSRGDDYREPVPAWSARAVVHVLNEWLAGHDGEDDPADEVERYAAVLLSGVRESRRLVAEFAQAAESPAEAEPKPFRITIADRFGGAPGVR